MQRALNTRREQSEVTAVLEEADVTVSVIGRRSRTAPVTCSSTSTLHFTSPYVAASHCSGQYFRSGRYSWPRWSWHVLPSVAAVLAHEGCRCVF